MKNITAVQIIIAALFVSTTARAETSDLKTQPGFNLGLSLSSYKYEEPGVMSLEGSMIGVDMRFAKMFSNDWSIRGELRQAFGSLDYDSNASGSSVGEPNWYMEPRFLVGRDWVFDKVALSPYTGGGYRYLYHDGRGFTTTGNWGYRRKSNYFYWPVGITLRSALNSQAKLVSMLEYDHLLLGKQVSMLSDGGQGRSDLTNTQKKGYGVKLSVMYEQERWAVGPFLHYWDIAESDWVPLYRNGMPVFNNQGQQIGGVEPKNNTVEFGLKASRQF